MLYDLLSGNGPSGTAALTAPVCEPPPTSSQLMGGGEPPDWDNLKDVIMASLTTGIFIDCKFYAPVASGQPSKPPNLQPLHFCSSINPGVVRKLSSGSVLCFCLIIHQIEDDVTRTVGTKVEPQA